MKYISLLVLSVLTLNINAQEKPIDLVETVLNELKIKRTECLTEFILEQKISNYESIIFIPEIAKKDENEMILDAHLLIVNNTTAKIESRFSKKECWYSDAIRLENIKILHQPYQVYKYSKTIGILIYYSGSSGVNPYISNELTLFERKGPVINRVLSDYPVYTLHGENDGNNNGEYTEYYKFIYPEIDYEKDFYDLRIIGSIIKTEYKDGVDNIIKKSTKMEKLNYSNGAYKKVF